MTIKENTLVIHIKTGNTYRIIGIAIHTETKEKFVVYKLSNKNESSNPIWIRPYDMFVDGRFEEIKK